ncbi:MAG TPA: EamA family transporter [Cyanothece sp. UBA12306]|nr:EamA family transporter [Cyanothece sp. UBA12306]
MINKLTILQQSFLAEPKIRAIAALAIGVLTFGFVPILIRLGESEISATAVIFHRLWIPTIILGLWNGLFNVRKGLDADFNRWQGLNPRTLKLLLGSGICFGLAQQIWAISLTQTSVANSALLHNFTPLFTILGGWLFFTQKFDRQFIIGMIIAIIGSIVLGVDDFLYGTNKIQGDGIALVSALFFAIYFLLIEQLRNQFSATTIIFYCCLIGTIVVFPFLLINQERFLPSSLNGWLTVFGLAFTQLLIHLLIAYTLKWLSSGIVTVILLLEPIMSAILAGIIFAETLDFWNILAFPIIFLGIYLATTSKSGIKDEASI